MGRKKYIKADFIDRIYQTAGLDRKDIQEVVDLFIKGIKDILSSYGTIELRGLGTFEVKIRKGRRAARNPRTGETFDIGSHGTAFFKPGRDLKKAVWNLPEDSVPGDKAPEDPAP